jgi:uncharacterized membrane protein
MAFLRYLMVLALIVWIGGIFFFAFVLAPTAFSLLPSKHLAGSLVGSTLKSLHWIGIVSGGVFLISSLLYARLHVGTLHSLAPRNVLIVLMIVLTLVSQIGIIPRMDVLRAALPDDIESVRPDDPARMSFDSLHRTSTRIEGFVLLLGLGLVYIVSTGL